MRAELKRISADEFDAKAHVPDEPDCFFLKIRLFIGTEGTGRGDNFELSICTPKWLDKHMWEPLWGRHLLVVREYDFEKISSLVAERIALCDGENWLDVASKLARFFAWEFEDYQG